MAAGGKTRRKEGTKEKNASKTEENAIRLHLFGLYAIIMNLIGERR